MLEWIQMELPLTFTPTYWFTVELLSLRHHLEDRSTEDHRPSAGSHTEELKRTFDQ